MATVERMKRVLDLHFRPKGFFERFVVVQTMVLSSRESVGCAVYLSHSLLY